MESYYDFDPGIRKASSRYGQEARYLGVAGRCIRHWRLEIPFGRKNSGQFADWKLLVIGNIWRRTHGANR